MDTAHIEPVVRVQISKRKKSNMNGGNYTVCNMFKSKIDENLKAEEISGPENEDICYEIVKGETEEKPLTLEEARKLVEKNYFLNKADLSERFEDIFGSNSDAFLRQYVSPGDFEENEGLGDRIHRFGESSSEDEGPTTPGYVGRGYGEEMRGKGGGDGPDIDEDLPMDDDDEITAGTIHSANRRHRPNPNQTQTIPMTNYGKGPPPFWSNVFDDSSSDDD